MKIKRSKIAVEILNPAPGGARFASLDFARRHVARGLARWEGRKLRIAEDHPALLACRSASEVTHHGEGAGMARLDQVQGLPIAGPAIRMFSGARAAGVMDYPTIVLCARPAEPISR